MAKTLEEAIARAQYLLAHTRNAAMATVNEDGSPHNTPFFFIHDSQLNSIYWGSQTESLHSKNVARSGRIFVVVYEHNAGGGVYIDADSARELTGLELQHALTIHNAMRAEEGKDPLEKAYYEGDSSQRMYGATPQHFYVNYGLRNDDGKIIKDVRQEIHKSELIDAPNNN